jgi:uncharacterized protein YcbK (DUF882 family)
VALAAFALPAAARADVTHVVQRGHTIEAIAHRYRVPVKAILDANHLTDPKGLRPGQTLVIPGVEPSSKAKGAKHERDDEPTAGRAKTASLDRGPEPHGRADRDAVHAVRLGEEFHVRVKDAHGHIPPAALKTFERVMRQGSATHAVDPRLVALIGIVSNHFAGRPIEVVSGFRPFTPTQYTPHSNHNYGRALDFRIRGVPNEDLRDFCRTLRNAGCGYYPNSTFVHLDVRETKGYWVDWSHPGEPPKYDKPGVAADEGASDVPDEGAAQPQGTGREEPAPPAAPVPIDPLEPHPMAPPGSGPF